jgi:radical SAM protein with 4Fe4S-binding SPASM domain
MNIPGLNKQELFVVRIPEEDTLKEYLIYAPLVGISFPVSGETVFRLENISDFSYDKDVLDIYTQLTDHAQREVQKTHGIEETAELSILLNYICNFSCSYCYSAKGRSGKAIDKDNLFTALRFFIDKNNSNKKNLRITFSGGGDPLMSPLLLKEAILYADSLAQLQDFSIRYGIVTNGTLLNREIIELVKQYKIDLVISFDVLEDVHNKQRSNYKAVCEGIDYLIENDIYPGIRSTITPLNVCRMDEMVVAMLNRFPQLGGIALETVLNPALFRNATELNEFYNNFIDNYFKAYELGIKNNFNAGNTIVNDIKEIRERACLSKFTLTPEGEITACSRISSPQEDFFEEFHYGGVTNTGVWIDRKKLDRIMGKNVYSYMECQSCVAKWHCSGACLLVRYAYNPAFFDLYCNFMRNMLIKTLLIH